MFYQMKAHSEMDRIIDDWNPHYTNDRFKVAQTIWGEEEEGLDYVYSDRLAEWDYEKDKAAKNNTQPARTAAWTQAYLSKYFDQEVEVKHIMAGFNLSSGYSYRVYGFKKADKDEEQE